MPIMKATMSEAGNFGVLLGRERVISEKYSQKFIRIRGPKGLVQSLCPFLYRLYFLCSFLWFSENPFWKAGILEIHLAYLDNFSSLWIRSIFYL